jgi:Uma2 family endonuclease
MAITARRLTIDDLDNIPEEHEGDRHELIDGELVVTPVPILRHQRISSNIVYALEQHVREHQLGLVDSAPTGVRLAPDTLLIPDACFVSNAQLGIRSEKTIDGPPDLVVEILSPGSRQRDLELKRALYARFKVPEYWIVDPDERMVIVLTLTGSAYEQIPGESDGTITSRVLPELALKLKQVFANA